jgi:cell division protein FtsB
LFKKKADPISDRARALSDEIAALEAQIKRLDSKLQPGPPAPRLRSTAMPNGAATIVRTPPPAPTPAPSEPIFEEVDQDRLKAKEESTVTRDHFNDLGVRKYDLAAFFRRFKNNFRGPPTANPKLVNYLAAGSIQGLRPMRYEKRVARNRFVFISLIIILTLFGVFVMLFRRGH